MDERAPRVLIAGGWTGGHFFVALAIAQALKRRAPGAEVRLGGASGGMEIAAAAQAGLPVETVWLDGIERGRDARALARNAVLPVKLAAALWQARAILRRFAPDVVVGVGAYVSFPLVGMAGQLGIPTLIHEANAVFGVANGLLAWQARVVCVGFEGAGMRVFGGDVLAMGGAAGRRFVHTGNPVRPEVEAARGLGPAEARARLGLDPARQTLLVTGGSLGSVDLNGWMLEHGAALRAEGRQIVWQCGGAHFEACRARLGGADGVVLRPFLDDMPAAYAGADLVVAGAGAGTLAELAMLGKPAVIVPNRRVSEDHQVHNARAVARAGGAIWEAPALGSGLAEQVRAAAGDPERLRSLGAAMAGLAKPGAADAIATEVARLASGPSAPPPEVASIRPRLARE